MQFSERWLRSLVNPPLDSEALAHLLTMGGLEVEDRHMAAPPFSGVVVGQVLDVARHPAADRLHVCKVDAGTGQVLSIVCGAPNVRAGIRVPTALIGASLPPVAASGERLEIKAAVMRGVASEGMLCSARELKLSDDHGGLLILPDDAPIGQSLREVLHLDDQVMTLKLTPNKADCLSVWGVAREVAALADCTVTPIPMPPVAVTLDERLPVRVVDRDLCGRFSGRIIRGVNARAATPAWMLERLTKSGQRSISALVDISNYVMLELGRPTHVFDLDRIAGALEVRWGRPGERLELLNGQTVEVDGEIGVIATAAGLESLAGIMGGQATAVSLETSNIYIEAAFWWPEAIQGRARRFHFSTEAAHRFERGVDAATTVQHLERISALVLEICGGSAGPIDDQVLALPEPVTVTLRLSRLTRILGLAIDAATVAQIFRRLNFVYQQEGERFIVTPPSYRFDISIEEDLIEEVARCYGFDRIPAHAPIAPNIMLESSELRRPVAALADRLCASDYSEVINFSFVERAWEHDFADNQDPLALVNPMSSPLAVMRSSLIGSLVANLRFNLNRKATRVRVFEIAKVFLRDQKVQDGPLSVAGIAQPMRLAALAYGPRLEDQWGVAATAVDFFDVKADLESVLAPAVARFVRAEHPALHPGRCAQVLLDGQAIGWIGELHPALMQSYDLPQAPVVFELDVAPLLPRHLPQLREIPKVPEVTRDLALILDARIEVAEVFAEIAHMQAATPAAAIVNEVILFDEYRGKGLKDNEKSLAFRFRLQDTRQTLSDEQIEQAMAAIVAVMRDKFDAQPRS